MFATHTLNRPLRSLGAAIAVLQLAGVGAVAAGQVDPVTDPPVVEAEAGATAVPAAGAPPEARVAASSAELVTQAAVPPPPSTSTTTAAPSTTVLSAGTATPPPAPVPPTPPPAPAPAPRPAAAPAPAPPAPASRPAEAPRQDPAARVQATYDAAVPAAWRGAIQVRFEIIEGNTSWASPNGVIQVARAHANGSDRLLRGLLAHEFGHLVAFRYGSYEYNGAAPEGWPAYSSRPEEAWADCVSRAFTGIDDPSHDLPSCGGESLSWTSRWLGAGPGAHERTG